MTQEIRVGVRKGGGSTPGYRWSVGVLDVVQRDTKSLLSEAQYWHMVDQVKSLAREEDPTHPVTVDVDQLGDLYELRDKGGVLGKVNVRVFFLVDRKREAIVTLGIIKKEKEGPTPEATKITMHRRMRSYFAGSYGYLPQEASIESRGKKT